MTINMLIKDIIRRLDDHEDRLSALEEAKLVIGQQKKSSSFKSGSTAAKILDLIQQGYFKLPKSISDIILELKTKDYHLKPSDLTAPLRRIVRKGFLKKSKNMPDGNKSSKWMYMGG